MNRTTNSRSLSASTGMPTQTISVPSGIRQLTIPTTPGETYVGRCHPASAKSTRQNSEPPRVAMPHSRRVGREPSEESGREAGRAALPLEFKSEGVGLAALIASGTGDGIAIVDPDGKLVFWNAAATAITGWSLAQAAEQNIGELEKAPGALIEIRDGKWV